MLVRSNFILAFLLVLTALQACGTASPRAIVPQLEEPVVMSVSDAVFLGSAGSNAYTCATWAATKLWLAPDDFAKAVTRTLLLGKANLTTDETTAKYILSFQKFGNAVYYDLSDRQTRESVWRSQESWPAYAKGCTLCCDNEAQAHLLRFLKSFSAWDGTPVKPIESEAVDPSDTITVADRRKSGIERNLQASHPDSPVGLLSASLAKRYAAGERPPMSVSDPDYEILNCRGLSASDERRLEYIAIGWDKPTLVCENTDAGQRLLTLRKWQCKDQPTRQCVCGRRAKDHFSDFFDNPMLGPNSIYQAGSMTLGPAWNIYRVDPDSLGTSFFALQNMTTLSPCTFED